MMELREVLSLRSESQKDSLMHLMSFRNVQFMMFYKFGALVVVVVHKFYL